LCDNTEQATGNFHENSAKYVCVKLNISCDKISSSIWMNRWRDGWMDCVVDGWMVVWVDGLRDGWKDR